MLQTANCIDCHDVIRHEYTNQLAEPKRWNESLTIGRCDDRASFTVHLGLAPNSDPLGMLETDRMLIRASAWMSMRRTRSASGPPRHCGDESRCNLLANNRSPAELRSATETSAGSSPLAAARVYVVHLENRTLVRRHDPNPPPTQHPTARFVPGHHRPRIVKLRRFDHLKCKRRTKRLTNNPSCSESLKRSNGEFESTLL